MEKYFKVFLLFVILYHRIDQFSCENSTNDGIFPDNCGIGLYQCRNGACINESLLCDGKRDCQNGDDEDDCIFVNGNTSYPCAKTNGQCSCYGDSFSSVTLNCTEAGLVSFPKLINKRGIQHIFIKGNKISKLTSSGTFSNLWKLESLTLQNNTISIIENNTFMGLGTVLLESGIATREKSVAIDLSDNNITKLTSRMFETVHSSVRFSFARNQISDIENDTFVNLAVEDFIDLSGNKLTTLRPGMFDGIKRVIGLFLQDNEISVIENNTFRANNFRNDFGVDITVLNISSNRITTLKPGMFACLHSLFDLHLQNNEIDTIENNTFDSLYMLSELNLHGNKLSKLSAGMFDTSPNLLICSLNLRNNEISIIERNTFNSLTGLETLDLSHNKLKKLEAYIFENNKKLKNILLSGNDISYIESTTFYGLPSLDILNLTNNPLHDVDKDLFRGNPQMYHLFVDDVHICCQTYRTHCNGEFDDAYFCENHTIAYVLGGIFLVIVIIFILAVIKFNVFNIKKCFSRQSYTVPNQGPHQL